MNYPAKEILNNFLSIITGIATAFCSLLILMKIVIVIGTDLSFLNEVSEKIILEIVFFCSCILGGLICASISTRMDKLHVIVTGISILGINFFFLSLGHRTFFTDNRLFARIILILHPFIVISGTFVGGLAGVYIKKKKNQSIK